MRQIVLDTETTGLETEEGHRVIEIGAVEILNRRLTGRHFHKYIHPERDIDDGAFEVHGLSLEFLSDKPKFAEVAEEFMEFVRDAELVIHNAPFDVTFLDYELNLLGAKRAMGDVCTVTDSLALARQKHPGQRNSLDALCRRYGVDNSARELHGALLDAEILADVYLLMTGGQAALFGDSEDAIAGEGDDGLDAGWLQDRPTLRVISASDEELTAHQKMLELLAEASGEAVAERWQ